MGNRQSSPYAWDWEKMAGRDRSLGRSLSAGRSISSSILCPSFSWSLDFEAVARKTKIPEDLLPRRVSESSLLSALQLELTLLSATGALACPAHHQQACGSKYL